MKRALAILWYVLTLRCEEAERVRCIEGLEPVAWWQRWAERLHRFACRSCRRARRELVVLNEAVRHLVHAEQGEAHESEREPALSSEARERIRSAIRSSQQTSNE